MRRAALALALAFAAGQASADPLSVFLASVFQPSKEVAKTDTVSRRRHHFRGVRKMTGAMAAAGSVGAPSMVASYYGGGERLSAYTASGERFRAGGFTAAHRTLPFGTHLRVCFRGCTIVRINDRGPAAWTGRSLDLSHGAASAIGMTGVGVARVSATAL